MSVKQQIQATLLERTEPIPDHVWLNSLAKCMAVAARMVQGLRI